MRAIMRVSLTTAGISVVKQLMITRAIANDTKEKFIDVDATLYVFTDEYFRDKKNNYVFIPAETKGNIAHSLWLGEQCVIRYVNKKELEQLIKVLEL